MATTALSNEATFPRLIVSAYRTHPTRLAMRKKCLGYWHQYTWRDVFEHVQHCSMGLRALGLQRGEKICIIGDNDPEWLWTELSAQSAGAIAAGIQPDATAGQIAKIVALVSPRFIVASDQEQVDKLLACRAALAAVQRVIYWDQKGLARYQDPWLLPYDYLEKMGRAACEASPSQFEAAVGSSLGSDVAIVCLTPGSEDAPKAVPVSYRSLVAAYGNWSALARLRPGDELISFNHLCYIVEQSTTVLGMLIDGAVVNFPEQTGTFFADLLEINPTAVVFPSVFWESVHKEICAAVLATTGIKAMFHRVTASGIEDLPDASGGLLSSLASLATRRAVRRKLGFGRLRSAHSTGAPLSPAIVAYFRTLGIQVGSLYSLTEAGGPVAPSLEHGRGAVMLADDGEILLVDDHGFSGYLGDPQGSAGALADGVFHTGDIGGRAADGKPFVRGRKSDTLAGPGASLVSLAEIESELRASPFIRDALVARRPDADHCTTVIALQMSTVERWATRRRLSYAEASDLAQRAEVVDLLRQRIRAVNAQLPKPFTIRECIVLPLGFAADEITVAGKLKRALAIERHLGKVGAPVDSANRGAGGRAALS